MRKLFVLLPLLAMTPAGAQTLAKAKPCKPQAQVAGARPGVRVRPLGEMPPAKQVLGVYREANGCTEPVVVRERVGAAPRR